MSRTAPAFGSFPARVATTFGEEKRRTRERSRISSSTSSVGSRTPREASTRATTSSPRAASQSGAQRGSSGQDGGSSTIRTTPRAPSSRARASTMSSCRSPSLSAMMAPAASSIFSKTTGAFNSTISFAVSLDSLNASARTTRACRPRGLSAKPPLEPLAPRAELHGAQEQDRPRAAARRYNVRPDRLPRSRGRGLPSRPKLAGQHAHRTETRTRAGPRPIASKKAFDISLPWEAGRSGAPLG